jgi:PhnB protein
MQFYQSVFGVKLIIISFKDFQAAENPSEEDLVMHSKVEMDNRMTLKAADTPARKPFEPGWNFSIILTGDNLVDLSGFFNSIAKGETTDVAMEKSIWGYTFGMCTDRFGVTWMVNVSSPEQGQCVKNC